MANNVLYVDGNIYICHKHSRHPRDPSDLAHTHCCPAVCHKLSRLCSACQRNWSRGVCDRFPFFYHCDGRRLRSVTTSVEVHILFGKRRRGWIGGNIVCLWQNTARLADVGKRYAQCLGAQQELLVIERLYLGMHTGDTMIIMMMMSTPQYKNEASGSRPLPSSRLMMHGHSAHSHDAQSSDCNVECVKSCTCAGEAEPCHAHIPP